jgi:hypothetical protein
MSSSKSPAIWGDWSEWTFDHSYSRYYRVRQNIQGDYDYEWDQPSAQEDVPRTTDDHVDSLANDMSMTTLSPESAEEHQAVEDEYTTDPESKNKGKAPSSKHKSRRHDRESHHSGHYDTGYGQAQIDEHYEYEPAESSQTAAAAVAIAHRAAYHEPAYSYAESSAAYGQYDDGHAASSSSYYQETTQHRASDELDQRYNVEHSSRFRAGEIFKVYWSEPKGAKRMPSLSGRVEQVNKLGQLVHTGFRRFIVIANDQGHCTCVPILTYENKACTKNGVKPDKHGIIHDERKKAHMLHREPDLGFKPIRAIMTEALETLARESRVNYSKPSTIEHNSLVWFIGRVHPDDFHIVSKAYSKCWAKKDARHRRA